MRSRFAVLTTVLLLAGCGGDGNAAEPYQLPQGAERVELDPTDFVVQIDNPYWPMAAGNRWVYRETDAEENTQRIVVTVTKRTKTIVGIRATVVHDRVTEDGELVEDTEDWYAQDKWGGVWYLGEATTEFEGGKPVSTKGSWEAGVDGAQPGLVIPPGPWQDPEPRRARRRPVRVVRRRADDEGHDAARAGRERAQVLREGRRARPRPSPLRRRRA
jgi:hypothetical protein